MLLKGTHVLVFGVSGTAAIFLFQTAVWGNVFSFSHSINILRPFSRVCCLCSWFVGYDSICNDLS